MECADAKGHNAAARLGADINYIIKRAFVGV